MQAAIYDRKIAPEQYSSPQRSYADHGITSRIVFDYQLYLQQTFYLACSDLKSCYDRIVHSTASLLLQCIRISLP